MVLLRQRASLRGLGMVCAVSLFSACGSKQHDFAIQTIENHHWQQQEIVGGRRVGSSSEQEHKRIDELVKQSTVALLNDHGTAFCSGTLITPIHVVTAAHCIGPHAPMPIFVGFNEVEKPGQIKFSETRVARKAVVNKNFSRKYATSQDFNPESEVQVGDIAVLQLTALAPESAKVARMLPKGIDQPPVNTKAVLAGFGITKFGGNDTGLLNVVESTLSMYTKGREMILFAEDEKSVCSGDSGGPVFLQAQTDAKDLSSLSLIYVGISSRANCKSLAIATEVAPYKEEWLQPAVARLLSELEKPTSDFNNGVLEM